MLAFFFIIGVSVVAAGDGVPSLGCIPICLRISSGEGMPGVGVTPGFIGFLSSSGLGIPGVGVAPFGIDIGLAGIPGVGVPFNGTGLVDKPAGKLVLSSVTVPFEFPAALFDGPELPQAAINVIIVKNERIKKILNINKLSC